MKRLLLEGARTLQALRRPTQAANRRLLAERGETTASFVIRDAVEEDVPALADLHAKTWHATYAGLLRTPSPNVSTYAIREQQWREAFARQDGSWFALVVQHPDGRLVGFARGRRDEPNDPCGDLNKIYLLGDYQRLGVGRRLVGHVVRRFLAQGVGSMKAYVDPANPSCRFFEALGAEWLREPDGRINHDWYVWHDLPRVAELCPVD